ncbi:hypothetical protein C5N14_30370 [Micromonospora sp. MW-13]|nr:hypothetical protein C5N14_30370 [Micromonospora sp. MW-13]
MVEHEGRGQPQPGLRAEPVAQLDGGQRVEPEFGERAAGLDGCGVGVPEDRRDLVQDEPQQGGGPLVAVQPGEPLGQRAGLGGAGPGGPPPGRPDQAAQHRGQGAGLGLGTQGRAVQRHGDRHRQAGAQGGVEEVEAVGRGDGVGAGAGEPVGVGAAEGGGHAAARLGPRPPGQGEGGQAGGPPAVGEGVEEGVGGGVVGLSGAAGHPGRRGVRDEQRQVAAGGQLVQVLDGVHLRPQHLRQRVGGERGQGAVGKHPGGVHDPGQRVGRVDPAQERGEGGAVGRVTRLDPRRGAQVGEVGEQVRDAVGVGAAPAGEQQVPDPVPGDQVAGEQRAQRAGAAGDEDGAGRVERRRGRRRFAGGGEAGHPHLAGPHGRLRFVAVEQAGEGGRGARRVVVVDVDEQEPAGVLGLRGPHQAPDGGGGRVGDVLVVGDRDGSTGQHHQPGSAGVPVPGQPALEHGEGVGEQFVRPGRVGGGGAGHREQDDVRHPGIEQRAQVGVAGGGGVGRQRRGAVAEHRPGAAVGGAAGLRVPGPVEAEQGVAPRGPGGGQVAGRQGAQGQRADPGDRRAGGVRDQHGDGVRGGRGEPDPQGVRAVGADGDIGEGERQPGLAGLDDAQPDGLHGGVEQGGVQAVRVGLVGGRLGERHLGVHVGAGPPGGAQPLEGRAVGEAGLGGPGGRFGHVQGRRAGRRPVGQARAGRRVVGRGEQAGGVPDPQVVGAGPAAVHGDLPRVAGVPGAFDGDLHVDAAGVGEGERGLEGQLGEHVGADLRAGAQRQLDEAGAGEQHGATHRVLGQPGVRLDGQSAGEGDLVAVGGAEHRAEQRVTGGGQPGGGHVGGLRQRQQPVAVALERVRGQVHRRGRAGEQGGPPHRHATGPQGRGGGEGGGGLVLVGAQHRRVRGLVGAGDLLGQRGQHAAGADLHERADAVLAQGGHGGVEPDGVADVAQPVRRGADLLRGEHRARDGGDHRDPGRGEGELPEHGGEGVTHRVHPGGVERVADPQPPGVPAQCGEVPGDGEHRVLGARDDDGVGAVDGGQFRAGRLGRGGQVGTHLRLTGPDGHHGAAGGQRLHEGAPGGDQPGGVGQGQHAGQMRGGDLADGVAGEEVRDDAPGLDEPVGGHLDGEEGRLRVPGAVEQFGGAVEDGVEGPVEVPVQFGTDGVEGGGEGGERGVQPAAHADALGALAGAEHGEAGGAGDAAPHGAGGDGAGGDGVGQRGQPGEEVVGVGAEQHGPVFEGGPAGGEGPAQRGRRDVGVLGEPGPQPTRLGGQRGGAAGGEDPGQRVGAGDVAGRWLRLGAGRGLRHRGGLDDDVGVGAAHPEGGDAGPGRAGGGRPGVGLAEQADRAGRPVDVRGRLVEVQAAGQDAVPHRHDHLDHAGDSGGGLGVPEVGLDRAEPQGPVGGPVPAVRGDDRLRLDRVAEPGAGAVRLDGVHVGGGEPGVREGLADHPLLGGAVRGGEAVAGPVLVNGGAADHGEHGVPVAPGVGEAFEQEQAGALAPAGAVGGGGEGLAPAVRGQAPLPAEADERVRAGHHGDAAGQGEGALAGAQRLRGEVQGDQRRGAGGVDGDGRALEAEGVGDPAGDDAAVVAGADERLDLVGHAVEAGDVVVVHDAGEGAGPAALQGLCGDAGPLDGLPGDLQQQPLLRVHRQGLAG